MTSEPSTEATATAAPAQFVGTPFRTSTTVPQLLNYTLLETAASMTTVHGSCNIKDENISIHEANIVSNWPQNANQISM